MNFVLILVFVLEIRAPPKTTYVLALDIAGLTQDFVTKNYKNKNIKMKIITNTDINSMNTIMTEIGSLIIVANT